MDPVIIVFAVVAAVILMRLYAVLGRRTGHEQSIRDLFGKNAAGSEKKGGKDGAKDNVVALPGAQTHMPAEEERIFARIPALAEIRARDPSFSPSYFLSGARAAYEMIVSSFAAGDREALRPLLSAEVFASFDRVISQRAERGDQAAAQIVSLGETEIVDARLAGSVARITVDLTSEQVRYVKNSAGAVIEGDPGGVITVTDRWTFERDLTSPDPNWVLVATGAAR